MSTADVMVGLLLAFVGGEEAAPQLVSEVNAAGYRRQPVGELVDGPDGLLFNSAPVVFGGGPDGWGELQGAALWRGPELLKAIPLPEPVTLAAGVAFCFPVGHLRVRPELVAGESSGPSLRVLG